MTDIKEEYQRHHRYFVKLPKISSSTKTRSLIWLSITLFTTCFFLVAAIRPTLVTIAKLNREIKDKTMASQQLQKKIDIIIAAQETYAKNASNLTLLDEAFPEKSEFPRLALFFEQSASDSGVILESLAFERIGGVADNNNTPISKYPLNFSLAASGDYPQLKSFLKILESSRRILIIKESTFSQVKKEDSLELQIHVSGEAAFGKKELPN